METIETSPKFLDLLSSIYGQDDDNQNGTAPFFPFISNLNSTSTEAIELENRRHLDNLRKEESLFINMLLQSDFEDGFTNDAIEYINEALKNSFATCMWIAELFEKYSKRTDEKAKNVIYGLLKIIAFLGNHNCFDYVKSVLLLILRAAMHSGQDYMQEAALMVIESWHSHEALDLLSENDYAASPYIRKYIAALKRDFLTEMEY